METKERLKAGLADRYEIDREVGEGGMATVYLAHDLKLHRRVAIKVFKPELTATVGADRFLREIEIAANLQHPNILPVYDSGDHAGLFYYVMPYVEAESLRTRLEDEGQLPVEEAVQIAREIADALEYAHSRSVVHRDVKPGNILMEGGRAILADFGVAQGLEAEELDRLSKTGVSVGTPVYMSPEQSSGEKVDGRSDIYSLGCVIYEMLAGEPPFTGRSALAIQARKAREPVPGLRVVREGVPQDLEDSVRKALAKVPADRFKTAAEFSSTLERAQRSGEHAARSRQERRRPQLTARRLGIGLLAFVGVALTGKLAWDEWGPGAPAPVGEGRLAVFPFSYHGDPDFEYLGGSMAGLLSTVLDGVGGIRTVDPSAVLGRVTREGDTSLEPESAREIAAELGADRFILGSIQGSGQQVSITASAYGVSSRGNEVLRGNSAGDASDQVFGLVNDLALQLLSAFGADESPLRLESMSTTSISALNDYLRGEHALQGGRLTEAKESFQRAVDADTTFALAWYRLSAVVASAEGSEPALVAVERALEHGEHLSRRDRLLAEAQSAVYRVDPVRAEELYRALVSDYPSSIEPRFGLASVLMQFGPLYGWSMDSVAAGFQRVLQLDPSHFESLLYLPWAAAQVGDLETVSSTLSRLLTLFPEGQFAPIYQSLLDLIEGDPENREPAIDRLLPIDDAGKHYAVAMVGLMEDLPAARDLALRLFTRPNELPELKAFGLVMAAHLEAGQGRLSAAREFLSEASSFDPAITLEHSTFLALTPVFDTPASELVRMREELERWDAASTPRSASVSAIMDYPPGMHEQIRLYLLGVIEARLSNGSSALGLADQLETGEDPLEAGALRQMLAHFVRAHVAFQAGQMNAALAELDSGVPQALFERTHISPFFSGSLERFMRGEILSSLGRVEEAETWFQSVWMQSLFDLVFKAPSHRRRAEIHEDLDDHPGAAGQYRLFLDLWENADPELRSEIDRAESRLGQLSIAGGP